MTKITLNSKKFKLGPTAFVFKRSNVSLKLFCGFQFFGILFKTQTFFFSRLQMCFKSKTLSSSIVWNFIWNYTLFFSRPWIYLWNIFPREFFEVFNCLKSHLRLHHFISKPQMCLWNIFQTNFFGGFSIVWNFIWDYTPSFEDFEYATKIFFPNKLFEISFGIIPFFFKILNVLKK